MNYPSFSDIEHAPLRIYNRTVMFFNILEDAGKAPAQDYASQFSDEEKIEMVAMTQLVKKHGPKQVKEWVTKNVVFPEYMTEEEVIKVAT